MPDRSEVIERLRAESQRRTNGVELNALITTAADLLEAGESRVEYRVVGENFRGEPYVTESVRRQADAEYDLETWKTGGALNGRIQERTVTEFPWTDVSDDG